MGRTLCVCLCVCVCAQELRDVLQEHDWLYEDTLEALRMFSEEGECPVIVHFGTVLSWLWPWSGLDPLNSC